MLQPISLKIHNKQAYNRWRLAVLLIRNKTLRKLRTHYLEELREINKIKENNELRVEGKKRLSANSLLENVSHINITGNCNDLIME